VGGRDEARAFPDRPAGDLKIGSLDALQEALEASIANASPLTRSIFARNRLTALAVQRIINGVMGGTVATVSADGTPHAAIVLVACHDGTIVFTVSPSSRLLVDLHRSPSVALSVIAANHDVIVQGRAECLGKAAELPELMRDLHRLSRKGRFTPHGWPGELYAIAIDKIFAS
jgi:pyridoxine/pyridoxamine 5'-phosphate oxidase